MRKAMVVVVLSSAACGGADPPAGPTDQPAAASLPFRAGQHLLQVVGDSFACGDLSLPPVGTMVNVDVTVSLGNGRWVARPMTASGGEFAISFDRGTDAATLIHIPVSAMFGGYAVDAFERDPIIRATGRTVTFGGSAAAPVLPSRATLSTVIGLVPAFNPFAGSVTFTLNGRSVTCPAGAAGWSLSSVALSLPP